MITPRLSSDLGVRLSYFSDGGYLRLEPRAALRYKLNDHITTSAGVAFANQYMHLVLRNDIPLPTDVWYLSNDTLAPSSARQIEFGLEAAHGRSPSVVADPRRRERSVRSSRAPSNAAPATRIGAHPTERGMPLASHSRLEGTLPLVRPPCTQDFPAALQLPGA